MARKKPPDKPPPAPKREDVIQSILAHRANTARTAALNKMRKPELVELLQQLESDAPGETPAPPASPEPEKKPSRVHKRKPGAFSKQELVQCIFEHEANADDEKALLKSRGLWSGRQK